MFVFQLQGIGMNHENLMLHHVVIVNEMMLQIILQVQVDLWVAICYIS